MEGNLDMIPDIAVQEDHENKQRRRLSSTFSLYQSERETFFSSACTLFREIVKVQINSLLFFFFQNIIVLFQLISSWFYGFFPLVWDKSHFAGKLIIGINCILQFSNNNDSESLNLPGVIIPFVINLLIDIFFFSLLLLLKKRGLISHQTAIAASLTFQFLLLIIYLPTFSGFASTCKFVAEKDPVAITFFILYIFVIGLMVVLFRLLSSVIYYPSNPSISLIATYNGKHFANIFFFEGIKIILVKFTELYDKWFFILVLIAHILFVSYQIYDLLSFPFVRFWCMPFFFGIYSCIITIDILTTASLFGPEITLIRFIIPIAVFICSWVISYFIFRKRYNSIAELLNPKLITDLEKIRYYEELPIKSIRQATTYIRVGFSKLIPSAIDGWLEIILARQYHNFDLWLLAGNLISFFPCNKQHLEECIDKLSVMHTSSTANKVLFARLIQILHSRERLSSTENDDKREEMRAITQNAINSIKTFWKDVSEKNDRIPTSRIYSIAGIIDYAKWNWNEVLSMYPNDPYLVDIYSCFLVECLGKFKTGLKWKLKSIYLESGYHDEIDPLFKSFIISMPRAWNDHLVDYFGNLQKESTTRNTSFEIMSAQGQLEKDIDSGHFDREAEKVYRWPQLRFCLTKAVSHYLPRGLFLCRFLKYFAFLCWFVLLIYMTIFYTQSFNDIIIPYEHMENFITIRIGLDELRNIIFFNFANKKGLVFDDDLYHSFLPEEAFHEGNYRTFNYLNSSNSFKIWSETIISSFIQIYKINPDISNNDQVSRVFDMFLNESIPRLRKKENLEKSVIRNISSKDAIIYLLWNYHFYSSITNDEYDSFLSNSTIYETTYLHPYYTSFSDQILADLVSQAYENSDSVKYLITVFIFLKLFVPLLILVPVIIIPLIIIHLNTLKVFKILKTVDADSAKVASQKLSKLSKFSIDYSSVNKTQSKRNTIIILIVLYTFFMIVPFVLCIFAFLVMRDYINYCTNLIDLCRFGSQRECIASEIFSYALMISISLNLDDDEFMEFIQKGVHMDILYQEAIDMLNSYSSTFFHGYDGKEGIYSSSSKIRNLHLIDKCNADLSQADLHPYYKCIGLERLISSFEFYSSSFASFNTFQKPDMKGELFVNLVHLSSGELYRNLNESRNYMYELIQYSLSYTRKVTISLLIVSIISIAINIFVDFFLEHELLQNLNAMLILLLHLPSPTIAENPSLYKIFINNKKSDDDKNSAEDEDKDQLVDPKQIIFNTTQTPIMCIGDEFIIEAVNKAFRVAFDYSSEQLVGKKLTSFIENPLKDKIRSQGGATYRSNLVSQDNINEIDENAAEFRSEYRTEIRSDGNDSLVKYTNEEKGAIRMYEKMRNNNGPHVNSRSKYPIQCICGNDSIINTTVTVYPVHDADNKSTISNFILKIENNRQFKDVQRKLEEANSQYNHLLQQLIPRELDNYLKDKNLDVAFSAKCVTVVAVLALDPFDDLNEVNDKFSDIMQSIENTASNHPPFMKMKCLFHILMFIGGLFSNNNENENGEIIEDKKDEENDNQKENNNNLQNNQNANNNNNNNQNQNQSDDAINANTQNKNENASNNNNNNSNANDNHKTENEENALHANVSIELAKDVRKVLNKILPAQIPEDTRSDSMSSFRIGKSKYAIAIATGGPVVCCLTGEKHKSFEIVGDVIDNVFDLLSYAPPKSIIIKESTKKLLNQDNMKDLEIGPDVSNERTYVL
ncbi:hypothetical protein M9Y10_040839 [Tritrichomonas musculus]|uniref:PAS domain-containing protein n=1 Tax=Tritrichomonas musculus TaxID=1915356 RepID=A0ABR2K385_9EUKA